MLFLSRFRLQRQGCIHGEDLPYFFGAPLVGGFNHFPRNYTKAEMSLSEIVMLYWSNFIRTGWVDYAIKNAFYASRLDFILKFHENEFSSLNFRAPLRNPNEQHDNRDRGKSKNIEWTPYESVHKKYLNLGKFMFSANWSLRKYWLEGILAKLTRGLSAIGLLYKTCSNDFEKQATSQFC